MLNTGEHRTAVVQRQLDNHFAEAGADKLLEGTLLSETTPSHASKRSTSDMDSTSLLVNHIVRHNKTLTAGGSGTAGKKSFDWSRAGPVCSPGRCLVFGMGGFWHEAMVLVCLPSAAPIGLSPLYIPTLCGLNVV